MEGDTVDKVLSIWLSGGWVMIPLGILAWLLYANAFTLLLYVRRTNLSGKDEMMWREWVAKPEHAEGRVGHIIRHTQDRVSTVKHVRNRFEEIRMSLIGMLDRRIRFLNTLVAAAPLLGLLGTVLGMLGTFLGIATSGGSETAGVVASGISEALVTTQTGLTIALPGLFIAMIVQRKKHKLEAKIARLESLTLTHLKFE